MRHEPISLHGHSPSLLQGGPLGTGVLCGTVLTCPWHGWQFDVVTGRHKLSATVRQTVHEVCERDGDVFVRFADAGGPLGREAVS
jgi:nitrite reductase/ring-hydroxylating ferredoxin subunit